MRSPWSDLSFQVAASSRVVDLWCENIYWDWVFQTGEASEPNVRPYHFQGHSSYPIDRFPVNISFGCCGDGMGDLTASVGWFCWTKLVLASEALIWVTHSSRWCILMSPNLRDIISHFTQRKQPSTKDESIRAKKNPHQNKLSEVFNQNEFTCRWLQRLGPRINRD